MAWFSPGSGVCGSSQLSSEDGGSLGAAASGTHAIGIAGGSSNAAPLATIPLVHILAQTSEPKATK